MTSTFSSESDNDIIITKEYYNDYLDILQNYETLKGLNKTIPKLTIFEKAKILGIRAQQIEEGAIPLIEPKKYMNDILQIVEYELQEKKTPFILKRKVGNSYEYWKIEDLQVE